MLTAVLLLTALALLIWSIAYERRRSRPGSSGAHQSRLLRRAGPFAGPLPADRDSERLAQELRALPGARADIAHHLRR